MTYELEFNASSGNTVVFSFLGEYEDRIEMK